MVIRRCHTNCRSASNSNTGTGITTPGKLSRLHITPHCFVLISMAACRAHLSLRHPRFWVRTFGAVHISCIIWACFTEHRPLDKWPHRWAHPKTIAQVRIYGQPVFSPYKSAPKRDYGDAGWVETFEWTESTFSVWSSVNMVGPVLPTRNSIHLAESMWCSKMNNYQTKVKTNSY